MFLALRGEKESPFFSPEFLPICNLFLFVAAG